MAKDFEISGSHYFLCVSNKKYPASLEARKIYQSIADPQAKACGQIRVIDESGEDYLYSQDLFIPIEVPQAATRAFALGS
jgi:hypothetical protein